MKAVPALAVIVTALALYVSRGVLDEIHTAAGWTRVALLPGWPSLVSFAAVGALGLLCLDRSARADRTSAARRRLGPLLLPALGLAVLALPYLPYVADAVPGLQMLAGPARVLVWLVIGTQLAWVIWQAFARADSRLSLAPRQAAVAIGVATLLLAGAAALRLAGTVLYPAGDEPHYLVIAQSLWRDGDLKIENNHARGDYREYFPRDLDPHYLTRGADGEIYSIHPVGMPVLMAPVYAAGGYPAVVFAFLLMAAVAAAFIWRAALATTGSAASATFGWAAVAATAPFLLNAFTIYPEIPAALAVAAAFTAAAVPFTERPWRWWIVGIACGLLPWLSTKYSPMSAALVVVALARLAWPHRGPWGRDQVRAAAAVLVPYGVALAGWFLFFYVIWGIPLPQAPYGALVQTNIKNLIFGAPGLLFDQEYGLLPYAPAYILAATGLWAMWQRDAAARRHAIEIVLVFGALLGTVGAFRIWWGGSASPGRPIASGLLLLAIPMAAAFQAAPARSARRAAQHLLLWTSIGIAGVLVFAQEGLLTANGRDGTSSLLVYLSPRWPAYTLAPSFIYHEAPTALVHSALWLGLAALAAWILRTRRASHAGAASAWAIGVTAAALTAALIVMPRLPLTPEWPPLDIRARARLPLLDRFDAVARPLGVEYTPFNVVPPQSLVAQASVDVEPGWREDPQPIRVLHNGRFSLPAGTYRIDIDWNGSRNDELLGLQVGRTGGPWREWRVSPRPGERWSAEFSIPMDAGFVGLRGSPELERLVQHVRFVPLDVVDAARRLRGPAVIGASQSGGASIFYYDTNASPEQRGFWVLGGRRTRVIIERTPDEAPLVLRVHSGPIANRLHLSAFGWKDVIVLEPQAPVDVEVPVHGARVTLALATDLAFVPREVDPSSSDGRTLGVWVEVVP